MPDGAQPVFFFDLADPHCYLAAEQVLGALPELAEWLPLTGAGLGIAPAEPDWGSVARRADELGEPSRTLGADGRIVGPMNDPRMRSFEVANRPRALFLQQSDQPAIVAFFQ